MAFLKTAVSSVAPSPLAPSARMLTQESRGGKSGRADCTAAGSACADARFPLARERGVDHGVLPARRGPAGPDGVLAAIEMKVLAHVAGFVNAGEAASDAEVHVGHEAVLGV